MKTTAKPRSVSISVQVFRGDIEEKCTQVSVAAKAPSEADRRESGAGPREAAYVRGMHKTIFLDRDDTIVPDRGHLDNVEGIELLAGAGRALQALRDLGFKLVLVTNQSGIGRGWFPESIVHAQHDRLHELLENYGVVFDAIRFCPHKPDEGCACRKPMPGLLLDAGRELGTDFECSWMIGNSESDIGAGRAAGCRTIRVGGDTDLARAADLIAEHEKRHGR
jgi:D-glycero-D-manno-heptose 1,7-bisphosphate phosphatase